MTVVEEEISGTQDMNLFGVCQAEERVLMTLDLDFGDIRLYPPSRYYGVLVFRVQPQDRYRLLECLQRIIPLIKQEAITKTLWIVEEDRIRIRVIGLYLLDQPITS